MGLLGNEIDEDTAKEKVLDLFADVGIENITSNGIIEGEEINSYSFTIDAKDGAEIYVDITQKGGWILTVLSDKEVDEEKISSEDAVALGKEYLTKFGYINMEETYYIRKENIITINYAYTEADCTMYPDLIKVKIALDDGKILGLEAAGYLNNHHDRR